MEKIFINLDTNQTIKAYTPRNTEPTFYPDNGRWGFVGHKWIRSTQKFSGTPLCTSSTKGYREVPANLAKIYLKNEAAR